MTGAGVEVQIHVAGVGEGESFVDALGHDQMAAAGGLHSGDGFGERFGVEGFVVGNGAVIGEIEFGIGDDGERGGDFFLNSGAAAGAGARGRGGGSGEDQGEGAQGDREKAGCHGSLDFG